MREKLILHADSYWISPYSFSVFIALREKDVAFDIHEINIEKNEHKEPDYQKKSFIGKIPCLQRGDFWLSESSAIVEFLEETYPIPEHTALLPKDFMHRGLARMTMAWIRSGRELLQLIEERSTNTMFFNKGGALSVPAQAAAEKLLAVADRLIPTNKKNLFGEWCIADSDLAFAIHRLILNYDPVPERIKAYAEFQWQRSSVREFLDHQRRPF